VPPLTTWPNCFGTLWQLDSMSQASDDSVQDRARSHATNSAVTSATDLILESILTEGRSGANCCSKSRQYSPPMHVENEKFLQIFSRSKFSDSPNLMWPVHHTRAIPEPSVEPFPKLTSRWIPVPCRRQKSPFQNPRLVRQMTPARVFDTAKDFRIFWAKGSESSCSKHAQLLWIQKVFPPREHALGGSRISGFRTVASHLQVEIHRLPLSR
jgi:hypothetical protein